MSAYGAAAAGAGAVIGLVGNLLKKKVKAPDFVPVVPGDEAAKAIAANQANLPGAENLTDQVNEFNQAQLLKQLRASIPGFDNLTNKTSEQVMNLLTGVLPPDVVAQINRSAAEQNVAAGVSGSGYGANRAPRDIGVNSLRLITQGLQESNRWLANARANFTAPTMNVTSMFVTPAQQIQTAMWNTENQWNVGFLQNQLKAAQAPRTLVGNSLVQFGSSLSGMGGMGAGGAQSGVPNNSASPAATDWWRNG